MDSDYKKESNDTGTNVKTNDREERVLPASWSPLVGNYRESVEKVLLRSSSGVVLGVVTGIGRAVYRETALFPEVVKSASRFSLVSLHFFALKEVCDRLKGRETIWSTFFAGGFTGWFYGLLRFRETVSPTRSFIAGVCASSLGLLALGGLESARDYIVFQWEQSGETEKEFYLLRLYHHLIGEDKELERLRAKRDALYLELFQLRDQNSNKYKRNSDASSIEREMHHA
ncbi:hypothetical protein GAYE_SCF05G2638 [Galdieria yellowstonensis]|uniref:Uncharacterized protein n=1 Tax=Galdieria yellowstonensis TaxID=3028027 RepID=A0AAV9IBF0_9RHOD|nr:hypothetical protein GAYE_SCF05G2638 [Galdieria yellowstonensis]